MLTIKGVLGQVSMPDQGEDKMSMTAIATIPANSSDYPNSIGNGNDPFINSTAGTETGSEPEIPTDTDTGASGTGKEGAEDGDRTTKYENNHEWVTAAVVMGSITGTIFTC